MPKGDKTGWFGRKLADGQEKLKQAINRLSEVPSLPEPIREVLRHTRQSLLDLIKSVRSKEDIKSLRRAAANIVAGAADAIAAGSVTDPSKQIRNPADVRHSCAQTIKYGAGVVDSVALIAGTFATAAAVPSGGISYAHFFALCFVMGVLFSVTVGASEIYSVTSLLAAEGVADPARAALILCAYPRKYRRSATGTAEALDGDPTGDEWTPDAGASPEAVALTKQWMKLSFAGALPVFNDRHMQDRLDRLVEMLNTRR